MIQSAICLFCDGGFYSAASWLLLISRDSSRVRSATCPPLSEFDFLQGEKASKERMMSLGCLHPVSLSPFWLNFFLPTSVSPLFLLKLNQTCQPPCFCSLSRPFTLTVFAEISAHVWEECPKICFLMSYSCSYRFDCVVDLATNLLFLHRNTGPG